jgi:hypothetical protein
MCDKCIELDKKIERYEKISFMTTDKLALESMAKVIARCDAEKRALHHGH